MTYKELLHQVSFDEIVPFIKRYHSWNALALYKIHYDYLCHLIPELGEETTATVSNGELDESWPEPHLDAHPFRVEEASIIECIVSRCSGSNLFYIYTDEDLGQDMRVTTVFYD